MSISCTVEYATCWASSPRSIRESYTIADERVGNHGMVMAGGGYVMMPTAAPIDEPLAPRTERNYFEWIDAGLKYGAY